MVGTEKQRSAKDLLPEVRSTSRRAFGARYVHPFLFGREVLEEGFQFDTMVTDGLTTDNESSVSPLADMLCIRHWVIAVKRPEGAPRQDRVFVGRGESNDIQIPHNTVSKLHAYFERDLNQPSRWFLVDTGSANGTKANGVKLPARARVDLVDGDTVIFGRCVFQWMSAEALYDRIDGLSDLGPDSPWRSSTADE